MTINFQVSFTRAVLVFRTQTAHFLSKMKTSIIKLNTLPNNCNWSLIDKLSWQKSVMRVDTKCQTHITPKNTFDPTQEAAKRWNSALLSVQQLPWRAEGMWYWWYFSKRWHLIGKFASRGLTVVIQNSMAITEYISNWRLTCLKLGGWSWWPPQCFWPLCSKRLGGGSFNLVTFNINVWSIKKVIFCSLGYLVLPWQQVSQGVFEIFWSYHSMCFLITKF